MMDAVNSVLHAKQVALDTQIQTAVMRKALDVQQFRGDAMGQLLETALQLSKAVGLGENFDALA